MSNFRKSVLLSGASTAVFVTLGASSAFAAAADNTSGMALEEITVTAQRRTQNLQDVPISISAFTASSIEKQNFKGVEDYFALTPNVSFTTQGSRDRKKLSLRGVSDQLSADANIKQGSFAFYIDEFNVAPATSNPQIVDVDRIEILRGPQGTYFGRNAVGGAINITTKQPTQEFYGEASVGYSRYNTIDTHGIVNVPLISDKLAVRVVGRYAHSDGNIKNINPTGGGNDSDYKYGKAIVRVTPTDRLTIDLTASGVKENVGMREGVPSGVRSTFAQAIFGGPTADPDGVGFWPQNTNKVNFNRPQNVGTKWHYFTGRIKYEGDSFAVTSVTGYIDSDEFLNGDIDGGSTDAFFEVENINRNSLSEELRIQSTGLNKVDWTIGGLIGRDRGHARQYTFAGADNPIGAANGEQVTSTLSDGELKSYAVFGEAVWHATDRMSVTLGGRYTHEKVYTAQYNTSSGQINNFVDAGASFSNFSPRLSVGYDMTDDTRVYATISRGFKSGGVQASADPSRQAYDPEKLTNYEAGVKGEFLDHRVRINAAAFYMDWKDMQAEYTFGVVNNGVISFETGIGNAASARSYGLELDAEAIVASHLTVGGSVGYLNAKFRDFPNAAVDGQTVDLSGFTLPNAPKWTLNAHAEYDHHVVADYDGFIRAEWFYKGGIKPDLNSMVHSGFPYDVPSHNVWNLRAGMQNDTFSVNAYVENLLNKKYYVNAYQKAFVGGLFVQPSYRNFGIKVTVKTN